MSEYRTRLIADVVTGKLDVRQASFAEASTGEMMEEVPDTEPLDDVESVADDEGASEQIDSEVEDN